MNVSPTNFYSFVFNFVEIVIGSLFGWLLNIKNHQIEQLKNDCGKAGHSKQLKAKTMTRIFFQNIDYYFFKRFSLDKIEVEFALKISL